MTGSDYLSPDNPDWGWEFRCEDFVLARIEECEVSGIAPADGLRHIAAWHSTYVDDDGHSWARCFTCEPSHGFPCTTMRSLASIWRDHPDYQLRWDWTSDFLADVIAAGSFRRAYEARKESA